MGSVRDTSRRLWREHPRGAKVVVAVGALAVALVAVRVVLPYALLPAVNHVLNRTNGVTAHIDDVDLKLISGAYCIRGITLTATDGKPGDPPLLVVERADLSVSWQQLVQNRALVGKIDVTRPSLRVVHVPAPPEPHHHPHARHHDGAPRELHIKTVDIASLQRQVKALFPFRIDRVGIHGGTVQYDDEATPGMHVEVDNVEISAKNLTNSEKLSSTLVATLEAHGDVKDGGTADIQAQIDPFADPPGLTVAAQTKDVELAVLNPVTRKNLMFDFSSGTLSMFTEIKAQGGAFDGWVEPVLHDPKLLSPHEGGFQGGLKSGLKGLWEHLLTGALKLLENPQDRQIAARVPLHGRFDTPSVDVVTAIAMLLNNAWVEALSPVIDGESSGVTQTRSPGCSGASQC